MVGEADEERDVDAREEAERNVESSLEFLPEEILSVQGPEAVRAANSFCAAEDMMGETGRNAAKSTFEQ